MFVRGYSSTVTLAKEEVRLAIERWINQHTGPGINVNVSVVSMTAHNVTVSVDRKEK